MTASPFDSKETWVAAVTRIFNNPIPEMEKNVLVLYSPQSRITASGKTMNWKQFVQYAKEVRKGRQSIHVDSHYFLRDGNMFADKHTIIAVNEDGTKVQAEALCVGEVAGDGRAAWIDEMARIV